MHHSSRPLSPHLQIYKMTLTMAMSVAHRATGIILYGTFSLFSLGIFSLALGESAFACVMDFLHSPFGKIILLGMTWALFHHALGGIRHFVWDSGRGFSLPVVEKMAKLTLLGSIVLTFLTWGGVWFFL